MNVGHVGADVGSSQSVARGSASHRFVHVDSQHRHPQGRQVVSSVPLRKFVHHQSLHPSHVDDDCGVCDDGNDGPQPSRSRRVSAYAKESIR